MRWQSLQVPYVRETDNQQRQQVPGDMDGERGREGGREGGREDKTVRQRGLETSRREREMEREREKEKVEKRK